MTTTYEVRRGKAVLRRCEDASDALDQARFLAHFPGQLEVIAVVHDEYPITSPPAEPIPFKGADRTAQKRRA